jgi:hypothetical protein
MFLILLNFLLFSTNYDLLLPPVMLIYWLSKTSRAGGGDPPGLFPHFHASPSSLAQAEI